MTPRERFEARRRLFEEDEAEQLARAAKRDPGEKILTSLRWSGAQFADWQRLLRAHPGLAEEDEKRSLAKADLHRRWRELHPAR